MLRLLSSEVYNYIFNITERNNKLELYTRYLDYEFSYSQIRDRIAEILGLSDISSEELEHETFGPKVIEIYRKLSIERRQTDGYYTFLKDYVHSPFRDSESYPRNLTGLDEDDIQLIMKQYNSNFATNKNSPGV